jgi:hypothetical protein
MKFWTALRWIGTAVFLIVLLLMSCNSAPKESNGTNQVLPRAAPEFQH